MTNGATGIRVPDQLVECILLGPAEDRQLLQDSPVLADVWLAYAKAPDQPQDLLITPHLEIASSRVAAAIKAGLGHVDSLDSTDTTKREIPPRIAYLQGVVAAKVYFYDVARILVPLTLWWERLAKAERVISRRKKNKYSRERIERALGICLERFSRMLQDQPLEADPIEAFDRYAVLSSLILWAGQQGDEQLQELSAEQFLDAIREAKQPSPAALFHQMLEDIRGDYTGWLAEFFERMLEFQGRQKSKPGAKRLQKEELVTHLIFNISLNRKANHALKKSVPSVKADAVKSLFEVRCNEITWAILDSGIDGAHDAFRSDTSVNGSYKNSRVIRTFDFTQIREIVSGDQMSDKALREISGEDLDLKTTKKLRESLEEDMLLERPLNWKVVERFVKRDQPATPSNSHGTHVAGILGAAKDPADTYPPGMCPDIRLYDFRILGSKSEDTEFAILAALQYIRYLNEQHGFRVIHGANLSLSILHDVKNFACGRTPICDECERLVNSGVVVVAAAGNHGYQSFHTVDGVFSGYAASSITDPGNADAVITVGATHRSWPHTYGVSYFSSRGPTGDGRTKPDLVAPGERIQAPVPGKDNDWEEKSGTSMAAPHVSGAAAMLMARYPELIGQPRRIKEILCNTATDLGRERCFQGHGMLDVLRAFQSI